MKINNKITESRVGLDNAKLLKEKGFGVVMKEHYPILNHILPNSQDICSSQNWNKFTDMEGNKNYCSRPTHSLVLKWIFINFHTHIFSNMIKWSYKENKNQFNWVIVKSIPNKESFIINYQFAFDSKEEAIEDAIQYFLKNMI